MGPIFPCLFRGNYFQRLIKFSVETNFFAWFLLGYFISFFFYFIRPIFLNPFHFMQIYQYVPVQKPIGMDLRLTLQDGQTLFMSGKYSAAPFPPLAFLLFSPLLILDFFNAYKLVAAITLLGYLYATILFPMQVSSVKKPTALSAFILATGLCLYGLHFELERGQFNVIAFFFCFMAIWIFHQFPKYRKWAYFFFSLSVQIKLSPLILLPMFIRNREGLRSNAVRLFKLVLANISLFFIMGPTVFVNFINKLRNQISYPYLWDGDHSIKSYVARISEKANEGANSVMMTRFWGMKIDSSYIEFILTAFVLGCIAFIAWRAYREKSNGMNHHLLLACTLAAFLLPSASEDYKLPILAGPIILVFQKYFSLKKMNHRAFLMISFLVLLFSYGRIHGVSATLRRKTSAGVLKPKHFLGLLLSHLSMALNFLKDTLARSVFLGKWRRTRPIVFSTVPFSQLWKGAQKKDFVPSTWLVSKWLVFSVPLS